MAEKKVGERIKEARSNAKLSQAALAELVGLSATDIGKAERGEKELSQTALKAIAKATGVTQKSLLEAPKGGTAAAASTAKKNSAAGTGAAAQKTAAAKTSATTAKKTTPAKKTTAAKTAATTAVELTAAEKTMLNAYRKADAETRKAALKLLKGEQDPDILSTLIQSFAGGSGGDLGGGLLGTLLGSLGKK